MNKENVIIIGSGPAGLTAAIYTSRAQLNPLVITGSNQGGQLILTTEVENFPGFPSSVGGVELIEQMQEQALQFGTRFVLEDVEKVEKIKDTFNVTLNDGEILYTKAVIVASGASAKWLNLDREHLLRNRGISTCATCDGPLPLFRGKVLCVVGGGDTACEEALFLTRFASKVVLIHRRDKLRASKIMIDRIEKHANIEILYNSTITEYVGELRLEGLKVSTLGTEHSIDCHGLFIAIGHTPNTSFLPDSVRSENGYIQVDKNVHTEIEGLFVCGDNHDTTYRQAITAAGFGCMAAIACERWLEM